LHAILELDTVIGIKVATLDSIVTFQRIADLMRGHPDKILITGEDRFLGYSITLGARAALVGMGAALTDLQSTLMRAFRIGDLARFVRLSGTLDRFAAATFVAPLEGYIRRMLWALAAEGIIPEDACDDPWGPPLDSAEREVVRQAVRDARAALG
jgi:4-hydroxy-tetrahydrodipicolinate synthase